MKNVLVTGGAGFVGRHLTDRLLDLGCSVTSVDDLSSTSSRLPIYRGTGLAAQPIFWKDDLRRFCRANPECFWDTIFHCAAVVGGRLVIENDPIRVATDLSIDAEFFQWLVRAKHRPGKVVYFSSSAVYPIIFQRKGEHCALTETFIDFNKHKLGTPDLTYGWAKLTGEYLAQHAAKKYDLNVVCYRPFSGYGEDQDLSYPFPAIIQRVLNRENPLTVWGSGDQERDFIHIDDCIEGVLQTMDRLAPGEALNLGTGRAASFKYLAKLASLLAGYHAEIRNDPSKPEGVYSRVADPRKLNQWFTPKITLEQGVKRALQALDKPRKAS